MSLGVVGSDIERGRRIAADPLAMLRRRIGGTYELDPWGLDRDATHLAANLSRFRWHVTTDGFEHVPDRGPALLVANRRLGWSEPAVAALTILRETGRYVRAAGGGDVDPISGVFRRFGAIGARADEVAAALRAEQVVLVPTRREFTRYRAGHLPIELIEPAVRAGVPVIAVAVTGWEVGRRWQVTVGAPVAVPRRGGPREVGQVAVAVAASLGALLESQRRQGWRGRLGALLPELAGRDEVVIDETGEI